jgi:diacylglycerol kinase
MKHLSRFSNSVVHAVSGLSRAWREEPNFRWESAAAILVIAGGLILKVSLAELALLILTSTMVMALELVNTMVEIVSDMLKPRLDSYIKNIKDVTAAAVALAAIGSLGVAACILVPPIINLLWR